MGVPIRHVQRSFILRLLFWDWKDSKPSLLVLHTRHAIWFSNMDSSSTSFYTQNQTKKFPTCIHQCFFLLRVEKCFALDDVFFVVAFFCFLHSSVRWLFAVWIWHCWHFLGVTFWSFLFLPLIFVLFNPNYTTMTYNILWIYSQFFVSIPCPSDNG